MANKKKTALPSPIQQLIAYAAPKDDKCPLSLPISETDNIDIEVKSLLSADEMVSFVSGVTNALFLNDQYTPALYELIYAKAIVAYFTNLEVSIPNEDLVCLVFNTNIIDKIRSKINRTQREEIVSAIHRNIEFKKQEILNTQAARLEESIRQIELLTDATSKISEQFNDIDMKQIADATVKLANIPEREMVNNILDVKFGETTSDENTDELDGQLSFNDGDENV